MNAKSHFLRAGLASMFHTRARAIAMRTYKRVQTGANRELGGVKSGLMMVGYQVVSCDVVKKETSAVGMKTAMSARI